MALAPGQELEAIAPVPGGEVSPNALSQLGAQTQVYVQAAKAASTLRAYRSDWAHFAAWCDTHSLSALPATPDTVALYLTALAATHRPSTLHRRLTVITKAHQVAGHSSPATLQHAIVGETLKGIRRTHGTAATRAKTPAFTADIQKMVAVLPATLAGDRNRALLLVGFAGGFRRSELAALHVEDVTESDDGLVILLRKSKTDPEGQGRSVALPYGTTRATCPVRAYRHWIQAACLDAGPVFRAIDRHGHVFGERMHPDSISRLVQRAAEAAGLDATHYAGHSLRAGLCTQAYLNGARELDIMRQTGHKSLNTVRKYIRNVGLFQNNPATKLGL